LNLYNNSVELN